MGDESVVAPRLGFGCVRLGSTSGGQSWRSDVRLVRAAVDSGVTLFDTADAYGNGVSERVLGRGLLGRRDDVEIATKVGYLFTDRSLAAQSMVRRARVVAGWKPARGDRSPAGTSRGATYAHQDFSASYLREAVAASLRRLRTDHIDVLQLHGPPVLLPELGDEIANLVASGKVLRFGIGAESLDAARPWITAPNVGVVQIPFGVLDPEAKDEILPLSADHSVDVWARGVLGGGLLGGVITDRAAGVVASSRTDDRAAHPKWAFVNELIELADQVGISLFELAIDYVRSFEQVSAVVIGVRSEEHLADNIRCMGRPLPSADLLALIEEAIARWVAARELT